MSEFMLLTNLDPAEADVAEILRRYKAQEAVERHYLALKGPLAVAPIFLENNRRIAALTRIRG
jgi:transposase